MTTKVDGFSPRQEAFMAAYLQSGSITQAAKSIGAAKRTVYQWLKGGLEEEIAGRQKKIADNAMKKMQTATTAATDYLLSVVQDKQGATADRIKAADLLTRNGIKAWESDRLATLADLEIKLEELSNEN